MPITPPYVATTTAYWIEDTGTPPSVRPPTPVGMVGAPRPDLPTVPPEAGVAIGPTI